MTLHVTVKFAFGRKATKSFLGVLQHITLYKNRLEPVLEQSLASYKRISILTSGHAELP